MLRIFALLAFAGLQLLRADPPSLVEQGFDAYRVTGYKTAMDTWLKDSPLSVDSKVKENLAFDLLKIQGTYGNFQSYQIVKKVQVSDVVYRAYAVLVLERGPVYMSFDVYKKPLQEVISVLTFNVKADLVMPVDLIQGK